MNKKLIAVLIIALVAVFIFVIFLLPKDSTKRPEPSEKLSVAASFYPLYFFAEQIGGEKAEVFNVTPSGTEPHDYEPTARDIAKIEKSRLLILISGFPAWGDKISGSVSGRKIVIVYAGEGLSRGEIVQSGKEITDYHIWLSPVLATQISDKILEGFVKADPNNALYYMANAETLKLKLNSLDAKYKQGLANCKSRTIITSHRAFGYLASAYNLNQIPIAGLSPDAEPSSRQLALIADFAKKHNVKVIFFESLLSPKLSQTIAAEVGAYTSVLDPIEGLAHDDKVAGKNYFDLMEQNLSNLIAALQCTL